LLDSLHLTSDAYNQTNVPGEGKGRRRGRGGRRGIQRDELQNKMRSENGKRYSPELIRGLV